MIRALAAVAVLAFGAAPLPAVTLKVQVEGIRGVEGILRLSLFHTAAGYPEQDSLAARTLSVPVTGTAQTVEFTDLAPGTWALAVLHDRNGNRRLDRGFMGVPREGIGASNGATRRLGTPRFEDARFRLPEAGLAIEVILKYW